MTTHINLETIPEELRMASQSRLVVMIYDEIVEALTRAIDAAERRAIEERCNAVNEAMELIAELASAIDLDQGGQIAENLLRLYKFLLAHLPMVNLKGDPAPAREALGLIQPLRNAWTELDARIAEGLVPGYDRTPAIASLLARGDADGPVVAIAAE